VSNSQDFLFFVKASKRIVAFTSYYFVNAWVIQLTYNWHC
jgi:hypothetical protein